MSLISEGVHNSEIDENELSLIEESVLSVHVMTTAVQLRQRLRTSRTLWSI